MVILGIETSCDETAAAIIKADKNKPFVELLSTVSPSSMQLHAKTGGIIPEIAAREQIKFVLPVIQQALADANITEQEKQIDAIAVTYGPGLIGSLLVGVETAKTLAYIWNKPIIPVNHLYGHIYANWIDHNQTTISFPALALIVSGGHTDLVLMKNHSDIQWLGGTRDDAAGEAIDKIGRVIGFPYPSGPALEKAALKGNPKRYQFPRPVKYDKAFDFSFSGLKAAALREIQKINKLTEDDICNIARGVQDAIIDVLEYKICKAIKIYNVKSLVISGGVAANETVRATLQRECENQGIAFFAPPKNLCTDNAAMIATAGFFNYREATWQELTPNPELYFD